MLFLFSGVSINIGPLSFTTINLDREFIQENMGFVARYVWVTIGLSSVSITLATILAVLTALGRLSSIPRSMHWPRSTSR
jgi:ABC-type amino acid transport system permease subunit